MTTRSPSTETIRFISSILSSRATTIAELPALITSIDRALRSLGPITAPPAATPLPVIAPVIQRAPKVVPRPQLVAIDVAEPVLAEPKRGRGRPRRLVEVPPPPVEESLSVAVEPPQSRLLRRSDILAQEQEHPVIEQTSVRVPEGSVRGVVKWFDGRAGKGVLRLTGVSGDVTLDAAVLARSGIKRLYKDQEVEATVQDTNGRVRLTNLSLPGRIAAPDPTDKEENAASGKRASRSLMIEVKRDTTRQSAARAEAEQLFAKPGKAKSTRRQSS